MCELFGLSASHLLLGGTLPLNAFRERGGMTADNPDGWGIAWREDDEFRLEKAPVPASTSARYTTLSAALHSDLIVAHVRKARMPPINTVDNTHPFLHSCCGRSWAFAHNGLVPEIVALEAANAGRVCQPEGDTDSEFAFCHLLSHVSRQFHAPGAEADWLDVLASASELIAHLGKFNFLLSDGEHLIAYGHDRLHFLESKDWPDDAVLIATEPLTALSGWTPFKPGELRIYRSGALVRRLLTHPPAPATNLETGSV